MSSGYEAAQKSTLKLKGAPNTSITKKKKKKLSKTEQKEEKPIENNSKSGTSSSSRSNSNNCKTKTKAEIAFMKRREKLDPERIKKKAQVSHKQRVEKFNEYLNNLSEHYEPAKVSWTK